MYQNIYLKIKVCVPFVAEYCDGDSDWKYFNESCYYVGNEKISWHDAHDKCKSMNSELASIHGTDEIDAIVSVQI